MMTLDGLVHEIIPKDLHNLITNVQLYYEEFPDVGKKPIETNLTDKVLDLERYYERSLRRDLSVHITLDDEIVVYDSVSETLLLGLCRRNTSLEFIEYFNSTNEFGYFDIEIAREYLKRKHLTKVFDLI